MEEDKELKVKQSTLNSILNYLGQRPYIEVAELIGTLHKDAKELNKDAKELNKDAKEPNKKK